LVTAYNSFSERAATAETFGAVGTPVKVSPTFLKSLPLEVQIQTESSFPTSISIISLISEGICVNVDPVHSKTLPYLLTPQALPEESTEIAVSLLPAFGWVQPEAVFL